MFVFLREPQMKEIPRYIGCPFANNNFIEIIQKCFNAFSAAEKKKKHATFNSIAFAATEETVHFVVTRVTESR